MNKLTAIRIKYDDGTYSDEIPVSTLAEYILWDDSHNLVDILGNIDMSKGTVQAQLNDKIDDNELDQYLNDEISTDVTNWLNTHVTPVGSAVIVDSSLTIEGAAADAAATGAALAANYTELTEEVSELNERLLDSLFETIFGMVFVNGDMTAAGALKDSTIYVRTNAPIKLFAGDVVVCNSGFKTGIRKFTGPNVSDYDGFEKTGSSANYTIKNTGWYIIIAGYTDGRVIDDSNRGNIVQNVYVKRTLSSNVLFDERQTNYLTPKSIHPFSSVGGDGEHAGINRYDTRFTTITFRVKEGTIITIPSNLKMLVRKCYGFSGIRCEDIITWATDTVTINDAEYINITFGKTDDSAFTESEIESLLSDIKFTISKSESGNTDSVSPHPFTSTVRFRYTRRIIDANGQTKTESPTKHAMTELPIRFLKGDVISVSNTDFKFAVHKYGDFTDTTYLGIVKAESSADYVVPADGYYKILAAYVDERTLTSVVDFLDVISLKRTIDSDVLLTSRANNFLPNEYIFPHASTGYTNSIRGINVAGPRIHTIPFKVCKNTVITPPEGTMIALFTYAEADMTHTTYNGPWLTGQSVTVPDDSWITLGFGRSEGTEAYTDEEIAYILANTRFTIDNAKSDFINVKLLGAFGDGVADDTSAIQSALNSGGTIYFPNGTYKVTTHLILYSDTRVLLDEGAVILRGGEYNMMFLSYCTDETLSYNGIHNIIFEGGTIDLGEGITQGGAAFGLIHCENIVVRNVIMRHNNTTYHFMDVCEINPFIRVN